MKKKFLVISSLGVALVTSFFISSPVSAATAPIEVRTGLKYNSAWGYYMGSIEITAIDDSVKIGDIIVNRGNCNDLFFYSGKKQLNFGESALFTSNKCSKQGQIREIVVETNKGTWTFNTN